MNKIQWENERNQALRQLEDILLRAMAEFNIARADLSTIGGIRKFKQQYEKFMIWDSERPTEKIMWGTTRIVVNREIRSICKLMIRLRQSRFQNLRPMRRAESFASGGYRDVSHHTTPKSKI